MRGRILLFLLVAAITKVTAAENGAASANVKLPPKEKLQLYLMLGHPTCPAAA